MRCFRYGSRNSFDLLGLDAVSVHERSGAGSSDYEVVETALAEQPAILTENAIEFRPLATEIVVRGERHFGLILTSSGTWPRSESGRIRRAVQSLMEAEHQPENLELWLA